MRNGVRLFGFGVYRLAILVAVSFSVLGGFGAVTPPLMAEGVVYVSALDPAPELAIQKKRTVDLTVPEMLSTEVSRSNSIASVAFFAPCTNPSAFGIFSMPVTNVVTSMSTCIFGGEYNTINGAIAGQNLTFTGSGGAGNYLTVHSGTPGGPVLADGPSPLSFTNTFTGTLYLHVNTNASCGTDGSCHTTTVQCTSCGAPSVPANDLCANAIPITAPSVTAGTTVNSTIDTVPTCTTTFGTSGGVWYTYTGDGGTATLNTCAAPNYDTKIGVYTGSCGSLVCVTGNDDSCGTQSQVSFPTTAGTVYRVLVTGFSTNTGTFSLTASTTGPPPPPVPNLVVAGTNGDDTLVLTATGPNAGSYVLNGGAAVPFSSNTSFTFNGTGGNDTFTINNPVGGLFAPVNGIDFNGGGQPGDNMNLLGGGGPGFNETYFVGTTTPPIGVGPGNNGDGLVRFTGPNPVDIRFTGLAPIVDTVAAANFTVNSTDAANTISVTNGGVAPRLRIAVDAFEPIDFDNKTNVTVNAGDGVALGDAADNVTVNYSNVPAALTTFNINGNEGNDIITVLARAGSYPLSLNGNENDDTINAGATVAGPGTLILNGSDGNDSLIGGGGDDIFDGGAGNDTFIGNGGSDNIGGGVGVSLFDQIVVPGTAAVDTIAVSLDGSGFLLATINGVTTTYRNFVAGPIATSGIEAVSVTADAGSDTINAAPLPTIPINVDGGSPVAPTLPGDGLTVNFTGTTGLVFTPAGTGAGSFTFTNRATVSYVSIESPPVFATSTSLTSSANPSRFGQSVAFTATVVTTPVVGVPTGTVQFFDNGSLIGSAPVVGGTAAISLNTLALGNHPITANYVSNHAGFANSGATLTGNPQVVNPANTATGVQTLINAPNYGLTLTATATVVAVAPGGGTPQGTVSFNDGGNPIAGCQNVALTALGAAVCTTTQLPAGNNKVIQAVYSGNANYNGSNGSATQTIGKAPLNVLASSHTVTYGDAAPVVTSTITGFVLGETAAALTTQPTCSTTYTQGASVSGSQYPTSCSGGVSGNYSFNYINGTVTVNKKGLTVTADAKTRAYGAANPALTATLTGFVGADNAGNSTTGSAGLSTTATATSPVGSYPITATLGTLASTNYSFTNFVGSTLSVTAVQLTVTANNQSRVYGAPNPTLTFSITGFVNGEGVGSLTGTPNISTAANATSAPGTYPITAAQGTLASPNYTFTTANGTLTVTQASTTTTITNAAALGNPTSAGQSYAVNWTTSPVAPATGTPTGNVTVTDGTQTCTAAVGAGTCNLTSTTSGTKTITATYAGDANFGGSTSQSVQHNVVNGLTGNVKQFIAFGTNTNLAGVTLTLLNTATQQATTTTTDAGGNYTFSTALGQSYTITPSGLGKAFEATSRTYTNVAGNISGADFIAYDVPGPNAIPRSARVSSQIATQGQPVTVPVLITTTGVETRVSFSVEYPVGPLGVPTVSCGTGAVGCTLSVNNSLSGKLGITVTPANSNPLPAGTRELVRVTFPTQANPATSAAIRFGDFPTAKDVRNAENNPLPMLYWTDGLVSFTGGTLLDGATISGRVTTAAGQGLRNATVTLIDTAGGRRTTVTSSFGAYQFEGLDLGKDYMLVVTSKRYRFATQTVNLSGNLSDVNLIGLE